jgi:hypothetical protein
MHAIKHAVTNEIVATHKTKKAATAQADQMTQAHREIDARHEGREVTFYVEKAPDPLPILGEETA